MGSHECAVTSVRSMVHQPDRRRPELRPGQLQRGQGTRGLDSVRAERDRGGESGRGGARGPWRCPRVDGRSGHRRVGEFVRGRFEKMTMGRRSTCRDVATCFCLENAK